MSFAALQCCPREEAESVVLARLIRTGHLRTRDPGETVEKISFHAMPGGRALDM